MSSQGTASPSVLGREQELDAVSSALSALLEGKGQVIFVTGESGIGKTTLARAVADAADGRGLPVFWGFAWESDGAPAYWPWTQLLGDIVRRLEPDAEIVEKVEQILPQPAGSEDLNLNPEQARFMLLEAVRGLLANVSRQSPIVLIFEDLHAADSDTLHMLHYVARHVRGMPVLLCGTLRDADARVSSGTEPLWRSVRDAKVLSLSRLTLEQIQEYLRRRGIASPDDEFVNTLVNTTSGNPLFVAELTDLLTREPHADIEAIRMPDSIQQVIHQQLRLLPEETADALTRASVLGRRFGVDILADLIDTGQPALAEILQPAVETEFVRRTSDQRLEFTHVLFRDVLYQSIEPATRETLHRRRAGQLRRRIDADDSDRWAELAIHLGAAGEDQRNDTVAAWREAGRRAQERLAFDEAIKSYERALDSFAQGPRFVPQDRCRLVLDLADAMLAQGNVEAGRQRCREAFDIARTLEEPQLMTAAALTYGGVFVVAKVDAELVAMLTECLQQLPEEDTASRARVAARLAAAKQPAPDPTTPMQMAREAIALARKSDDERVVYDVLKSAVSALMDFAPVDEVMALNGEVSQLARKYKNVPDQFRSYLRLMMEASELGDRREMDYFIDGCERIATRINLPHYQWRVASARAMQATIEGNFAGACKLLADAEKLARTAGDASAGLTLPIQRFAILYEWDSPMATPIEVIDEQLSAVFKMLPDAETYARPMFASFAYRTGETDSGQSILDGDIVERLFAGNDRFCVARLAEVAIDKGDLDLARRAYDALLPYRDHCSTMGLMGTHWSGPVAYSLGQIAAALAEHEQAGAFFDHALQIARRMRAEPSIARIHESIAALARERGDRESFRKHSQLADALFRKLGLRRTRNVAIDETQPVVPAATGAEEFSLQCDGDVWRVSFRGKSALIRSAKGLNMLARLVAKPDVEIHVLDLTGDGKEPAVDTGDAGPALDDRARSEYRRRVAELEDELEEAESCGDPGRADAARAELDFIAGELSRAFGLGGRRRAAGSAAERARINVRRRVKDAIRRIDEQLPGAGRYLESTVKTGLYCRYAPM